jgi:hypothetical protein
VDVVRFLEQLRTEFKVEAFDGEFSLTAEDRDALEEAAGPPPSTGA